MVVKYSYIEYHQKIKLLRHKIYYIFNQILFFHKIWNFLKIKILNISYGSPIYDIKNIHRALTLQKTPPHVLAYLMAFFFWFDHNFHRFIYRNIYLYIFSLLPQHQCYHLPYKLCVHDILCIKIESIFFPK